MISLSNVTAWYLVDCCLMSSLQCLAACSIAKASSAALRCQAAQTELAGCCCMSAENAPSLDEPNPRNHMYSCLNELTFTPFRSCLPSTALIEELARQVHQAASTATTSHTSTLVLHVHSIYQRVNRGLLAKIGVGNGETYFIAIFAAILTTLCLSVPLATFP